jgi:serine/threonine protein kinase
MLDPNERQRDRTFSPKAGGHSRLFRLVRPPTNEASAAKELNLDDESQIIRELVILRELFHPAIVGLIGYSGADKEAGIRPMILTEWMSGGSLDGLLWSPESPKISATIKMKIIVGVVLGMRYVHASGIVHRDIKPQSILLTRDCEPKIGDLSSARLDGLGAQKTAGGSTALYMAPELVSGGDYGREVDVFSFGIMLWEIVTGEKVFTDLLEAVHGNGIALISKIVEGARPNVDDRIPTPARDLMVRCWANEASDRPTFAQLFEQLSGMRYQLLPAVDTAKIEAYVAPILAFEAANPPYDLRDPPDLD